MPYFLNPQSFVHSKLILWKRGDCTEISTLLARFLRVLRRLCWGGRKDRQEINWWMPTCESWRLRASWAIAEDKMWWLGLFPTLHRNPRGIWWIGLESEDWMWIDYLISLLIMLIRITKRRKGLEQVRLLCIYFLCTLRLGFQTFASLTPRLVSWSLTWVWIGDTVLLILRNSCWTMIPALTGGTGCPQPVETVEDLHTCKQQPISTRIQSTSQLAMPTDWIRLTCGRAASRPQSVIQSCMTEALEVLTGRSCRPHRSAHQQVQYQARCGGKRLRKHIHIRTHITHMYVYIYM